MLVSGLAYSSTPRKEVTWQLTSNGLHSVIFQKVELFNSFSVSPEINTACAKGLKCFKQKKKIK
jgi:hypothetical protein